MSILHTFVSQGRSYRPRPEKIFLSWYEGIILGNIDDPKHPEKRNKPMRYRDYYESGLLYRSYMDIPARIRSEYTDKYTELVEVCKNSPFYQDQPAHGHHKSRTTRGNNGI